ncbi:uracil-xanthine permease family protein [Limisalsivibrio acetivorans]|uniref:uracil-xanthine permease family protein n=1 Tax=Limisalsivibrio acetivorans TaxID=1304888 RepID=UPI0003B50905|nr:nucleobase:cation symporter-2 family protein [Limisalsivibrio acetivorans]
MSNENANVPKAEIIYGLEDRPPVGESIYAAIQHLLAIIVGIMTPPLIIGNVLGLEPQTKAYLISMSLFVSGVATFIQCRKFGPIGSGLLSIQGTSFAFLGSVISVGFMVKGQGGGDAEILRMIFGVAFVGAFIEIIISRFLPAVRKVITPLVSGIVVTLIGLSLIKVAVIDFGGGMYIYQNKPELFAQPANLGFGFLVLITIIILNRSSNRFIRMGAIVMALAVGYVIAAFMGLIDFSKLEGASLFAAPIPFKYGFFDFSLSAFIPIALIYLITAVESIGDLTATSMVSNQPIKGDKYIKTISGGVLGDGVNSAIAAVFNSFPNTTFSQNNGVIQLTGVASRYVGYFIALLLVVAGLFPILATLFSLIPNSVLGGATVLMFGTVAAAGIKIIASSTINRRGMLIIAISMGLGLGVTFVPEVLNSLPPVLKNIFSSSITTGGLTAIICNVVLPRGKEAEKEVSEKPSIVEGP